MKIDGRNCERSELNQNVHIGLKVDCQKLQQFFFRLKNEHIVLIHKLKFTIKNVTKKKQRKNKCVHNIYKNLDSANCRGKCGWSRVNIVSS